MLRYAALAVVLLNAAVVLAPIPAVAQKQKAPLLPTLGEARTLRGNLSGVVRVEVSGARDLTRQVSLRAPFGRDGIVGELRLGDTVVATFDTAPFECDWDTTRHPDGGHVLRLVAVDTKTDRETLLEQTNVFLRNGNSAAPAASPGINRATRSARGGPPPDAIRRLRPQTFAPPLLPAAATLSKLTPRVSPLKSLRDVQATVLHRGSDYLVIGLRDGGIAVCTNSEAERGGGTVVRLPQDAGATRAAAVAGHQVFWVTGRQDVVYRFDLKRKTLVALDVSATNAAPPEAILVASHQAPARPEPAADGWIRRLSPWRGKIALVGAGRSQGLLRVLSADGKLSDLCDELPPSVADVARAGDVNLSEFAGAGERLAVSVRERMGGTGLHLFTSERSGDWTERVTAPVSRSAFNGTVAVSAWGIAALDPSYGGGTQAWTWNGRSETAALPPLQIGGGGPLGGYLRAGKVSIGGSGVWVGADGVLFHVDLTSGKRAAYLPWNGAGGSITDLAADKDGVWVATSAGVRHVTPAHSTPTDGFGGYVRARLDEPTGPRTESDHAALAVVEDWQGAPYLWGGESKAGTDCSGYVGAIHRAGGVELPRTSKAMGTTSRGRRVRDELQWGDTLVFPGHVAFYLGNGQTAETTNNAVGKATIWRRRTVIVKRFLH